LELAPDTDAMPGRRGRQGHEERQPSHATESNCCYDTCQGLHSRQLQEEVAMTSTPRSAFATHWGDIAAPLLRIGATAYGGPAIMGIMQAELQEKRGWVSKERFVEGLSLVNMLPAATAAQLTPLGVAWILLLAGGAGLWLFHSRRWGTAALAALAVGLAVVHVVSRWTPAPGAAEAGDAPGAGLVQLATFLLKVGALTFGGGLTMIAFIQEHVVAQF